MTRAETIRAINDLARLMVEFGDDQNELALLTRRMQIRLDQLKRHIDTGRPDLRPVA